MITSRRALLGSGAALAALTSLPAGAKGRKAAGAWPWQKVGGDPFAHSETEAFARLPEALRRLRIPVQLHAGFITLVKLHPGGMATGILMPGDHLDGMLSGHEDHLGTVICEFKNLPKGVGVHTREWMLDGVTLILPETCFNWSKRQGMACPEYILRGLTDEAGNAFPNKVAEPVEVEVGWWRNDGREIDVMALLAEPCLKAYDDGGQVMSISRGCGSCDIEAIWPEGVKTYAPSGSIVFQLPSGSGRLTVPEWLAVDAARVCFKAKQTYPGKPPSRFAYAGSVQYKAYFDLISAEQAWVWRQNGAIRYPLTITPRIQGGQ